MFCTIRRTSINGRSLHVSPSSDLLVPSPTIDQMSIHTVMFLDFSVFTTSTFGFHSKVHISVFFVFSFSRFSFFVVLGQWVPLSFVVNWGFRYYVIGGVSGGALLLLIGLVAGYIYYRSKNKQSDPNERSQSFGAALQRQRTHV